MEDECFSRPKVQCSNKHNVRVRTLKDVVNTFSDHSVITSSEKINSCELHAENKDMVKENNRNNSSSAPLVVQVAMQASLKNAETTGKWSKSDHWLMLMSQNVVSLFGGENELFWCL